MKVGDLLINHIINRVIELGKRKLKIEVVISGEQPNKLIKYYEDRGFVKTGIIQDFPRKHCLKSDYIGKVFLYELQCEVPYAKY